MMTSEIQEQILELAELTDGQLIENQKEGN